MVRPRLQGKVFPEKGKSLPKTPVLPGPADPGMAPGAADCGLRGPLGPGHGGFVSGHEELGPGPPWVRGWSSSTGETTRAPTITDTWQSESDSRPRRAGARTVSGSASSGKLGVRPGGLRPGVVSTEGFSNLLLYRFRRARELSLVRIPAYRTGRARTTTSTPVAIRGT